MTPPSTIRLVLSTAPNAEEAERLARCLVEEGLAACVNIVPGLVSVYRWQGEIQREAECQLLIKCRATAYHALEKRLRELHPYELPEILALEVAQGLPAYLRWVADHA